MHVRDKWFYTVGVGIALLHDLWFSFVVFSCRSYVVEQLRCLGVLRTCEVLKVGMPTRISYIDLKMVRSATTSPNKIWSSNAAGTLTYMLCCCHLLLRTLLRN